MAGHEVEYLPLSDLLAMRLTNGRSVPTSDDGFPVLRLTALTTHGVNLQERKSGAWTASEARRFLVSEGDFLVARGNGSIRLVGRGSLVRHRPDPVAFPDTIIRVRPNSDVYLATIWTTCGILAARAAKLKAWRAPPLASTRSTRSNSGEFSCPYRPRWTSNPRSPPLLIRRAKLSTLLTDQSNRQRDIRARYAVPS